jgi:hypothetical protein
VSQENQLAWLDTTQILNVTKHTGNIFRRNQSYALKLHELLHIWGEKKNLFIFSIYGLFKAAVSRAECIVLHESIISK